MIKVRLRLLAERLEKIDATVKSKRVRTFDIRTWVRKNECNTVACAVGEATFMKRFRDLGLRWSPGAVSPAYKNYFGWLAVQKFFGLTLDQATWLFTVGGYGRSTGNVGPGEVAARIRELLGE